MALPALSTRMLRGLKSADHLWFIDCMISMTAHNPPKLSSDGGWASDMSTMGSSGQQQKGKAPDAPSM